MLINGRLRSEIPETLKAHLAQSVVSAVLVFLRPWPRAGGIPFVQYTDPGSLDLRCGDVDEQRRMINKGYRIGVMRMVVQTVGDLGGGMSNVAQNKECEGAAGSRGVHHGNTLCCGGSICGDVGFR
jgi:hypothetical protein